MRILRSRDDLAQLDPLRAGGNLVLVPTMGALHAGHLSLVERAADLGPVVVSIFVNPMQFGPGEDFKAYPRDLERDLDLLAPLEPAAVFAPEAETVYGPGESVAVAPGRYAAGLCGDARPGHFRGVLTVVAKFFGLVRPDVAVFGRKDAQQCLVIGEMVDALHLGVRLVDAPTVREADGLALSSRNRYLDDDQRLRAACLHRGLTAARGALAAGERNRDAVLAVLAAELHESDAVEYAVARRVADWQDPPTLGGSTLLAVAARVGGARLIDNLVLDIAADAVRDTALFAPEGTP